MSNRKTILAAIANDPATVADLTDVTGWPQRKVRDTIGDLKNVGLAVARRDDITGQPMYAITPAGREWLASKTQVTVNEPLSVPDPAPVERKQPDIYADGLVIEMKQANPDGGAHYTSPQLVNPPFSQPTPDAAAPTLEDLKPETVREICQAQRLTIDAMRMRMAMLEQEVADKAQRIAALESNAALPLRTATAPAKYALTFLSELHDSPEAAMAKMLDVYDPSCIDLAVVVACETVGKIELRPMLVPA